MADLSWLEKVWCNYKDKAAAQAGSPTASARREGDRGLLSRGSGWLSLTGGGERPHSQFSRNPPFSYPQGVWIPAFAGVERIRNRRDKKKEAGKEKKGRQDRG
jgi:hypothetical protein